MVLVLLLCCQKVIGIISFVQFLIKSVWQVQRDKIAVANTIFKIQVL